MSGGATLPPAALDGLMPMHVLLDAEGRIGHVGPALRKLAGARPLAGLPLFDAFSIRRPAGMTSLAALLAAPGRALHLSFASGTATQLRGVLMPLAQGQGALLNLSLALTELSDLGRYGLTCTDFAATDKTVDMLYLIEAKSAAMTESRQLIHRLQGARIAAEEQAFTDTLTGLGNRRALDHILARMVMEGRSFSLTQIDLDFFKQVNDGLGHAAGDHVLQTVARRLTRETRTTDTVARVGGDEFVVIFDGLVDHDRLREIGRRMIASLERPITYQGTPCLISASLGTTVSTCYREVDVARMLADADRALYASKDEGRARHTIFGAASDRPATLRGERRAG